MQIIHCLTRRPAGVHRHAAASLAVVALLVACDADRLLDVEPQSRIPAASIENPANATLLLNGAIGDFECAFGAYTVNSGIVGEELIEASQTAARQPPDRRNMQSSDARWTTDGCEGGEGVYTPLQTARASSEKILALLRGWTDAEVTNRTSMIATAAAYAGYSIVVLGEGFCTMAFSVINPDQTITYGGEIQRDSVFKVAVTRFTEAIAAGQASGNNDIVNMARVGRARAYLNLGNYTAARADAAAVPAGYVKNSTTSSAGRRTNKVWSLNAQNNRTTSIGEPYRSMNDPRVPVVNANLPPNVVGIRHWYQTKYAGPNSPIPLATADEAHLIIAEADIRAGNLAAGLVTLNRFRARGNQGVYSGPVTQSALLAELVDQRRRELFLESHHLGDLIRYNITPMPAAGTPYHGGGVYGDQKCFPLPNVERLNNPLIGG